MQKLNSLKIIFENCEALTIPAEDILHIEINNISKNYSFIQPWYHANSVNNADKVMILISKDANTCKYFDTMFSNITPFERITRYNDITHLNLRYEGGVIESYEVTFNGNEENSLQHSEVIDSGSLIVKIGE